MNDRTRNELRDESARNLLRNRYADRMAEVLREHHVHPLLSLRYALADIVIEALESTGSGIVAEALKDEAVRRPGPSYFANWKD